MPAWVSSPCADYLKRMPTDWKVKLLEVPAEKRAKSQSIEIVKRRETVRLLEAVPNGNFIVALDERGSEITTPELSKKLSQWQLSGSDVSLLIGGADGIDFAVLSEPEKFGVKALRRNLPDWRWSLSQLTLPHLMVRVLLFEQLYRAWTIHVGHPYHRE